MSKHAGLFDRTVEFIRNPDQFTLRDRYELHDNWQAFLDDLGDEPTLSDIKDPHASVMDFNKRVGEYMKKTARLVQEAR